MSDSRILDKTYHSSRKAKKSFIYRLDRRTKEVIHSIQKYFSGPPSIIVDMGTADGLMLGMIKNTFPSAECIGIELSRELIETNTNRGITLLQSNVNSLPISNNTTDIIVATAVIEHLPIPEKMLQEAMRALRPDGLMILTSPDPFWERAARMVGHLHDEQHCKVMNLRELVMLFKTTGYKILEQKKFMLSPVGMPLEIPIENILRNIGLNFLFANQLVIGKKIEDKFTT